MCESDADSLQHAGPHLAGTDPADAATPKPILNSADSFRRQHVVVHEADPEENSDPRREREHREIRNQPSTPAIRELSSGRSLAAARYLAGQKSCYLPLPPASQRRV
jgi:hypothetical protein